MRLAAALIVAFASASLGPAAANGLPETPAPAETRPPETTGAPPAATEPAPEPAEETTAVPAPADETREEPAAAPPALDLAALEGRLRETDAIGFFTKLSLKNQVDDLLARFRRHYNGDGESLDTLHEAFNLLLLKVLTLLQDDDPPLFRDVARSRGELWAILADPSRFNKL